MRLVIELKRGAIPKVVLNKLYKHTPMQTTFGVNMVALVDGVPRTLDLRELIHALRRATSARSSSAAPSTSCAEPRRRAHILEGLLIALDNLDAVIELIRASRDPDAARDGLIERFELSRDPGAGDPRHAPARLTALEADKIRAEHADLIERIGELRAILGDEARVMGLIKEELAEIVERLRRRAPHRDHPLRGRHRHRGHDRRPADGDLDHPLRLRQVAAARHLPPAAPRRPSA